MFLDVINYFFVIFNNISIFLPETALPKSFQALVLLVNRCDFIKMLYFITNIDTIFGNQGSWKKASHISYFVNVLNEELIDFEALCRDSDSDIQIAGEIIKIYNSILDEQNMLDFSAIQTQAYFMLKNNPAILAEIQEKIQYIMIDEYQDTNYIQEQIVFLLAGEKQNIAVVGDDDQGLYRFRGATIHNILEFPQKFEKGKCERVSLVVNYRSDSRIVDFYNNWMSTTGGKDFKFEWDNFRYDKTILPFENSKIKSQSVVKVIGENDEDEWHETVLKFIKKLMESGKVTNLNQIAFLFNSVRSDKPVKLANYLEQNGINIYSPRSNMFFQRDEVMLSLGILLLTFTGYVQNLNDRNFTFVDEALCEYYERCIMVALKYIKKRVMSWHICQRILTMHFRECFIRCLSSHRLWKFSILNLQTELLTSDR